MELTYRTEGDYRIPNLTLPAEKAMPIGKYGRLRHRHLKQHRRILYKNLKTTCALNQHLAEIDQTANERMERLPCDELVLNAIQYFEYIMNPWDKNMLPHLLEDVGFSRDETSYYLGKMARSMAGLMA